MLLDVTWQSPPVRVAPREGDRFDRDGNCLNPITYFPDDLPRLERDPFSWTNPELTNATRTARHWLFEPKE